jgi:hypothetical protein
MVDEMDPDDTIRSQERLAALQRTGLLDSPYEEVFDRLTRLVSKSLGAPVALISLVDADRQWFKSAVGLPEPWASRRETPLSHSFCRHVVASGEPLVVTDARAHPLVRTNRAVTELGVVAYAGIPLVTSDGHALGALCTIDGQPREWTAEQLEILGDLAAAVIAEIELRRKVQELQTEVTESDPGGVRSITEVSEEHGGGGAASWPRSGQRSHPSDQRRGGTAVARPSRQDAAPPLRDTSDTGSEQRAPPPPDGSVGVTISGELHNELRNALNGIIGFSEVLADEVFGSLNSRQARYVSNILTSGRHLLDLLDDLPGAGGMDQEGQ